MRPLWLNVAATLAVFTPAGLLDLIRLISGRRLQPLIPGAWRAFAAAAPGGWRLPASLPEWTGF